MVEEATNNVSPVAQHDFVVLEGEIGRVAEHQH